MHKDVTLLTNVTNTAEDGQKKTLEGGGGKCYFIFTSTTPSI